MNAPENTRPFSLNDAKAGAPVVCRNGDEATILKFDLRNTKYPLFGLYGPTDEVRTWNNKGEFIDDKQEHHIDIFMAPLGFIDGKPVFVGDAIEDGGAGDWTPGVAHPANRIFTNCRWPAPKREYPETLMRKEELHSIYVSCEDNHLQTYIAVANSVLRHAIDAGQVLLPSEQVDPMKVAVAVRNAINAIHGGRSFNPDIPAIIASVKAAK